MFKNYKISNSRKHILKLPVQYDIVKETHELDYQDNNKPRCITKVFIQTNYHSGDGFTYNLSVGEKKNIPTTKNLAYYPLYLILNVNVSETSNVKQIGYYAINKNNINKYRHNDTDCVLDIVKLNKDKILPRFYSFVTPEYLENIKHSTPRREISTPRQEISTPRQEISTPRREVSTTPPFTNNKSARPSYLESTSENELNDIDIAEFYKTLETYTDNNNDNDNINTNNTLFEGTKQFSFDLNVLNKNGYKIIPNSGGGDCFFHSVAEAFASSSNTAISRYNTNERLREFLANNITNDAFDNRKIMCDVEDGNLLAECTGMNNVHNLYDFKKYIKSSIYWGDELAITIIEKKLNVKFIIFRKEDKNIALSLSEVTNPQYYILLWLTGRDARHYELLSHKNIKIFTFSTLPIDIKLFIANYMYTNKRTVFSNIKDFKGLENYQNIYDIYNGGGHNKKIKLKITKNILYDPNITLNIGATHNTNNNTNNNNTNNNNNNIQMLDNNYIGAHFELDGHKWASVLHYITAMYIKNDTNIFNEKNYLEFSLDSDSSVSKHRINKNILYSLTDINYKIKHNHKHNYKKTQKKYKNNDLIKQLNKYEFKAIEAKVMQNDKIAETLKATKNAKLIKENTNMHTHSHVLYNLMLIRQKLINN